MRIVRATAVEQRCGGGEESLARKAIRGYENGVMVRMFPLLFSVALGMAAAGCGTASRGGGNQMMLVRQSPGTLGYQKLMAKSAQSGDLKLFFEQKGLPDFVAEANSSDRQYLILYYLDKHQAFACRAKSKRPGDVEFAGPYPITAGEWKLLTNVKKQADQAVAPR